ncbi:MAG: FAD-dependent oxidoreductase [Planctomycetes bacterium]|nr:FAD-dependent oxidoreductase [Planctomycetota bacterium]
MQTIREPEREIPVKYDVDVVVCGGGTAGVAAAVCAGRIGLSVVMVEQGFAPGGLLAYMVWSNDFGNKGGFAREFFAHLVEEDIISHKDSSRSFNYNPFTLPPYLDRLLKDAYVRPLYRATVAGAILDGGKLGGVFVETKEGRIAVKARTVIDATGDGDVAARAGAKFAFGRAKDGAMQAISLGQYYMNFTSEPVEMEIVEREVAEAAPEFTMPYVHGSWKKMVGMSSTMMNGTMHVCGYNTATAEGISDALVALRAQGEEFYKALKKTERMRNIERGPYTSLPGVRESRRITCDYMLTLEDTLKGSRFDDGIFTVAQNIDIHKCLEGEPGIVVQKITPYHIPYRSLLPQGLENLFVVGRCIGGEHEALASYRIIADCFAMGEAAAIAARQAKDADCSLRAIDVPGLVAEMKSRGYSI